MPSHVLRSVLCSVTLLACVTSPDEAGDPPLPEQEDNDPTPTPPDDDPAGESLTQASNRVINQWQQCMQLADFQAANMAPAWASLRTQQSSTCTTCHATGGNGFIATPQAQLFFDTLKTQKYTLLVFVTPDLSQGAEAAKMVINRPVFEHVATAIAPHAEHPRFAFPDNAGMTALRDFYDRTMARITSGECSLL
jgi:hypothetical protein